jgi:hypothetical protein
LKASNAARSVLLLLLLPRAVTDGAAAMARISSKQLVVSIAMSTMCECILRSHVYLADKSSMKVLFADLL